jgi:hypothetical protein
MLFSREDPEIAGRKVIGVMEATAKTFNASFTSVISRDDKGRVTSAGVYAEGTDARELARWAKGRDSKRQTLKTLAD